MSEEALPAVQKMQESIAALKPLLPTWSEQVQGALATGFASPDDGHSWPVALVTMIVAGIVVEAIANLKLRALLVSSIEGITGTFALCSVALVRVAFEVHGVERVDLHCEPGNEASARIAGKLGFRQEAVLPRRFQKYDGSLRDIRVFSLHRPDYGESPCARQELELLGASGQRIFL